MTDGHLSPPSLPVRVILATRRTDQRAVSVWRSLAESVSGNQHISGVVFDRTASQEARDYLTKSHSAAVETGRLSIVVQGHTAPLKAITDAWRQLPRMWTCMVHDDDHWTGAPTVGPDVPHDVSLLAPSIWIQSAGMAEARLAHRWTSQHALFGAVSPHVQAAYLEYTHDSPLLSGGEDLLMLFLADSMGRIHDMPGYDYYWDPGHWDDSESTKDSLANYLSAALASDISSVSRFVLIQSMDRLAACAYIPETVPLRRRLEAVRHAVGTFWPVVDPLGHSLYRLLPERARCAVLKSSGQGRSLKRMTAIARQIVTKRSAPPVNYLQAVESGATRLHGIRDIQGNLIPALRKAAAGDPEFVTLIDFWDQCLRTLERHGGRRHTSGKG